MSATHGPDRIRELNSLAILDYLRSVDEATVSQIAQETGLSRTSVGATIADCEELGWVASLPPAPSITGRPAKRYRFQSEAGVVVGLDIGANHIDVMATNLIGASLASARADVSPDEPAPQRLGAALALLDSALEAQGVVRERLTVISVALTGPVDAEGRSPYGTPLPGWDAVDISRELRDRYGCAVLVENDCKCALAAEAWTGQAQDLSSAAYIVAGARIGASFMIDGTVCRGAGGAAGEVGALKALKWSSTPAVFLTHSRLPADIATHRAAQWVCDQAREGDREAIKIARSFGRNLAVGASALVLTVDPEALIVGGGISASADVWMDAFTQRLTELVLRVPDVRTSNLGSQAVVLGAVRRGLDHVEALTLRDTLRGPQALFDEQR